ncbi:unnamed protein product [Linum trigynum]|uniref:DUF569 domain-containing protein n=1 Tax=Linum trigynum TaxID=586398 RepID=A0AAV2CM30_9ROSI
MEFFTKTKAVKLRSHLDKYLLADDDRHTVRQTRSSASSRRATWFVELLQDHDGAGGAPLIRLRSSFGTYLSASDAPFLLGVTGCKVVQAPAPPPDQKTTAAAAACLEWRPVRDGFQVRLQSWCGKYLRGNGGTPPWRNSVTHDDPHTGATQKWIMWDVEAVIGGETESVAEYLSSVSSLSSLSDEMLEAVSEDYKGSSSPRSPMSVVPPARTPRLTVIRSFSPKLSDSPRKKTDSFNQFRSAMEFFHKAKAVRLRSHHDKYLLADDDEESVLQDRNGSSKSAKWWVEPVPGSDSIIRLKSSYGKYLTASNHPFLLGMTGRKVLQTLPRRLDSSVEWEPVREGTQIKLRTRYGNFLRANGGLPPWRNSVTHDIPHRTATQDWVLWDMDVVEIQVQSPAAAKSPASQQQELPHADSLNFEESSSPSSFSAKPTNFSRQESTDSNVGSPPKLEGRTIYYHVADETGEVEDDVEVGYSLSFKGNGVEGLTQKLKEETGLEDIVVCSRSPLNGKLYPLRLQLPPNNADMHVIVVPSSSKVAREFEKQGLL